MSRWNSEDFQSKFNCKKSLYGMIWTGTSQILLKIVTYFDGRSEIIPFCDCHLFIQHLGSQKGVGKNWIGALKNNGLKDLGDERKSFYQLRKFFSDLTIVLDYVFERLNAPVCVRENEEKCVRNLVRGKIAEHKERGSV